MQKRIKAIQKKLKQAVALQGDEAAGKDLNNVDQKKVKIVSIPHSAALEQKIGALH